VLLPASASDWSDARWRAVLTHELAHIRRGDWIIHLLAEVTCAAYWFHPLFWMARNGLCRDSEHAADDIVLSQGTSGTDHAAHLLAIVRAARAPVRAWSPTVAMARASHLERRVSALLDGSANRATVTQRIAIVAVAIADSGLPHRERRGVREHRDSNNKSSGDRVARN
jgi:beta-lactamase regulating signal transducer with metallopeptidase domain